MTALLGGLSSQMGCLSLHRSCRRPALGPSNGTLSHTCMRTKDTYHVEVSIDEREPVDAGMRRFRRAVMDTNLINEARRRRYFENTQDIKKRKMRERGQWKRQKFRTVTYDEQQGLEPAPFADLFGEADDLFESDLVPEFMNGGSDKSGNGNGNGRQKARGPKGGYTGGATVRTPQEGRQGGRR